MAFKQSQLQQIPQRNKDLTFGYVRECEKKNNRTLSIPEMIKYLCLIYINQNKDKFDGNSTCKGIRIEDNSIKKNNLLSSQASSLLTNIVMKGIHIWRFRIDVTTSGYDMIGIRKSDESDSKDLDRWLDWTGKEEVSVGYGFFANRKLSNPDSILGLGKSYGRTWQDQDVVEMRLDFNDLSLSFGIDGHSYGKAFDIKPGKYRAGVTLSGTDSCYCLISYQHVY